MRDLGRLGIRLERSYGAGFVAMRAMNKRFDTAVFLRWDPGVESRADEFIHQI
jgi:hypothetical protein